MGGTAGTMYGFDAAHLNPDELAMARVMMPLYFVQDPITPEEKAAAKGTFDMIINNKSERFFQYQKEHPNTECQNAVEFMHACFFARLFHIHPSCKPMFKNGTKKMNLVPILSMFFEMIDHPQKLHEALHPFVQSHARMGVKTIEFGIAGECAMHAIRAAVGPDKYSNEAGNGWCKIFSILLASIIPEAMKFELDNPDKAKQQTVERGSMARDSIQQCVTCVRLQGEFDDNVALQSTMCSFCLRSPSIEQLSVRNMGAGISNPNLASVHAMHRHPSEHPHRIVEEPANVPESPAHKDQMNAAAVATPDAQAPATSAPAPTVPSNAAPPAADAPVVGAEQTRPTEPTAEVLP